MRLTSLPKVLVCPVAGCSAAFSTTRWFMTSNSIKRHLRAVHRGTQTKESEKEELSTGDPGDMRLAPPPAHFPAAQTSPRPNPGNGSVEDPPPRGRIDFQVPSVLASFLEPLNMLLEVDEISDVRTHVEDIVNNVTQAVHEHFHLQRPKRNRGDGWAQPWWTRFAKPAASPAVV
ncbi:hypothetical protein TNCV_124031 [Trichonephila clavipes]|nr:hypothetical protein TNCV_124031 [Trichonephila clavipes]